MNIFLTLYSLFYKINKFTVKRVNNKKWLIISQKAKS